MPLFTLQLDSSISIRAVATFCTETYEGGLAIGKHSEERVQKKYAILKDIVERIRPCPIAIIPPSDLGGARKWCLPFYTHITWFVSDYVRSTDSDASHLATIHFQDVTQPYFNAENQQSVKALRWDELSDDFGY